MHLYHIEKAKYQNIWPPRGALYADGRWNRAGQWILYTSPTVSLAKLEILANENRSPIDRVVMTIEVDDNASILHLNEKDLPDGWTQRPAPSGLYRITQTWIEKGDHLIMAVPSVQSHKERNFLINLNHPCFPDQVKLVNTEPEPFDLRLKQVKED